MLERIGTKKVMFCEYDEREHNVKLYAYVVKLTGNTYANRHLIWNFNEFYWSDTDKAWFANIESEARINEVYKTLKGTGVNIGLKPVWGIIDKL